ncbi:MAG TPA: tetratricopeptide repeat-containing glycosyltransferase family protein [Patescibacteria group bacterium]|nr:tetratricopeptide repeat-containing glycosyltransferase family protein [Patescibacteria group bacterium]
MAKERAKKYFQQGMEHAHRGKWQEAANAFERALKVDEGYGPALINRGYALYVLQRRSEAETCLRRGIALEPTAVSAHNNLGLVLLDEKRPQEAAASFRQALTLKSDCAEVLNNLALALEAQNDDALAEELFRRAVQQDPGYYEAWYNLGRILKGENRLTEAADCYRQSLRIHPRYAPAAFGQATLQLMQGQFEQGWKTYDQLRVQPGRRFAALPRWQGESLQGRRILLFQEQGFGDTLQFVRYSRLVAAAAEKTALWVQEPLLRLLNHSVAPLPVWSDEETEMTEKFDFACPLPSLPCIFRTTLENIPGRNPYIMAPLPVLEHWRQRCQQWPAGLRVGVVWAGNPRHHNDYNRSVPLAALEEWFNIPGVCWVSLQKGLAADAMAGQTDTLIDCSDELNDFAETAGVIANLDLVITVDSAVGHLAGAMGKPVWMMIPFAPDWRWLLERQDSPWYPSMRLFRQQSRGDWPGVAANIKEALQQQASQRENG